MTALSQEILERFPIRKTKKQKTAFIQLLAQHFPELKVRGKCRNIIIGDIDNAKVILTAHYNTCSRLPIPSILLPKRPMLSVLYSVLRVGLLCAAAFLLTFAMNSLIANVWVRCCVAALIYFGSLLLLMTGPANQRSSNNTSGLIALCELANTLDRSQRAKVAFVLIDRKVAVPLFAQCKKQTAEKLLIHLDSVSDGDHILVSAGKAARGQYAALLKNAFRPTEEKSILFANAEKVYIPSGDKGFKQAVTIAALKHKERVGFYMNRTHTLKDTALDKANIKLICESVLELLKQL